MPARKRNARSHSARKVKIKASPLTSVKMAVAMIFLGVAVFAAAAAGTIFGNTENPIEGVWCAYRSEVYGSKLEVGKANYCGSAKNAKECVGVLKGNVFNTNSECASYLSPSAK